MNISKKLVLLSTFVALVTLIPYHYSATRNIKINKAEAYTSPIGTTPFTYNCNVNGRLSEAASPSESTSPYWWANSGGYMYLSNGVCSTISGNLPALDFWRNLYKNDNPVDTDIGFHPQNIFRLVTKAKWAGNISQQMSVKVTAQNLSASTERDAWSGILLFNRYQDGNNLYYAGIRDDGHAVIKSKKNGNYKTLAEVPYFSGNYNRSTNPTLMPINKWIGVKSQVTTNPDSSVTIKLYVDNNNDGHWTLATSATDRTNPILANGYGGLRLDFRDAQFDNYRVESL